MSYRDFALLAAVGISVLGLLIEFIRLQLLLRGFGSHRKELKAIASGLEGEFDRDGDDLLLRGHYGQWPVLIRFSRSEYEAGLSINMPVPSNLTLFCYPNAHIGEEGHVPLQVSDARMMSLFRLSTNNSPLEVSMILSSPAVQAELSKIMDSQSYLTLENRNLELAEAVIVPDHLAARTLNCVRGLARIAAEATEVHGGSGSVPKSPKQRTNWFRVGYLTASALIIIAVGVATALSHRAAPVQAQAVNSTPAGIPANLGAQIPQLQGWHIAEPSEFDLDAVAWLQQQGERPSGQIATDLNDQSQDTVLVLKRPQGAAGTNLNRVIVFIGDQKRFDAELPQVDGVGRISKDRIPSVQWRDRLSNIPPNGNGVILIQRYRDPASAIIFFTSGSRLLTAVPKDFRSLNLQ
jgi:hypothetical protein